jgi:DNA-binding LacI/PurR family transcriptional regulator
MRDGVSAVIAESPDVAETLGALLATEGLRVPDDLSAVCLETPLRSGRAAGWSHLVIPKREVGRRTVNVLRAILAEELPLDHHEDSRCSPHHRGTITTIDS